MASHEVLRECLAPFEGGRGLGWTDDRTSRCGEDVDDAAAQMQFGPDHREVHGLTLGNRQQLPGGTDVGRQTTRSRGNSWVAGRANHRLDIGFAGEFPGEGVLARATSDDQNFHGFRLTGGLTMACTSRAPVGQGPQGPYDAAQALCRSGCTTHDYFVDVRPCYA